MSHMPMLQNDNFPAVWPALGYLSVVTCYMCRIGPISLVDLCATVSRNYLSSPRSVRYPLSLSLRAFPARISRFDWNRASHSAPIQDMSSSSQYRLPLDV